MKMRQLHKRLFDATARIETIVCIAGMLGDGDAASEPLEEFLRDELDNIKRCFPDAPAWLLEAVAGDREAIEAFHDWAVDTGRLGFLVRFATPVMSHAGSSQSFSWGYFRTRWVYADTLDAAIERGFAWVAAEREAEKSSADAERDVEKQGA